MIKSIVLDISKHLPASTQTIVMRQGDVNSLTLNIAINEDAMPFGMEGFDARFMAQLKNGKVIIDPCEKAGGNMLSYTPPPALTAKAGTISLSYIAIYQNEQWVASTEAFAFCILPGVDVSAEEAESFISEFLTLKEKFNQLIDESNRQKEEQQISWEEQMSAQQAEFDMQEEKRKANEAGRIAAESNRVSAEAKRIENENLRQAAEYERQSKELARNNAESSRVSAEKERVSAEQRRSAAEANRASAESARASAEQARASAEDARKAAENNRVAAETMREKNIADALASLETVTIVSIPISDIDALWAGT